MATMTDNKEVAAFMANALLSSAIRSGITVHKAGTTGPLSNHDTKQKGFAGEDAVVCLCLSKPTSDCHQEHTLLLW